MTLAIQSETGGCQGTMVALGAAMLLDLKFAVRALRTSPLFTMVALATLAVGIGANAAVFSIVHAVFFRPLPYPRSDRLVSIYTRYLPTTGYDFPYFAISGPELADLQTRVDAFSAVAGYQVAFRNVAFAGGDAERVLAMAVTPGFFDVVAVTPAQGRTITEADVRGTCVAVLHNAMWQRQVVAGGPMPAMRIDDMPCEIIGVMPSRFGFGDDRVQLWTALANDASESPGNRESHGLQAAARLGDDVTMEQADAQLQSLRRYWAERFPDHYAKGHFAVLRGLRDDIVGDDRPALLVIAAAVGVVLLIICVNLAGLLVSRSEVRRQEFAMRRALGAGRFRLIRLVFSETAVLAVAGGVLGVVLANWILSGLLALYPDRLPVSGAVTIDARALLFAVVLVVASAGLVGILPALHASGRRLQGTLKAEGYAVASGTRGLAARSVLVTAEIALSVVLLVGALLLIRTYANLQAVDPGFDARRLLTFFVSVPPGRESDAGAARRLLEQIERRLASLPGVERAAATSSLPLVWAGPPDDFAIDGRPDPAPGTPAWNARYILATPSMFETLGVPLKQGRLLRDTDGAGQPLVAVINETAARHYWPDADPIGRTIRYYPRETSPAITIVGVVGDVRSLGAAVPPPPAVYVPFAQSPRPAYEGRSMTFVLRTRGIPEALVPSVRASVVSLAPGLPLANVRSMESIAAANLGQPRFTNVVMSSFAVVAVFLAGLGLYGVLAYNVEQRRREIGVRIALGASSAEIVRLVVRRGLGAALGGLAVGLPAAFALSRVMESLVFGVSTNDAAIYVGVAAILGATSVLAGYLPARRAVRVDPVIALRSH